MNRVNFGYQADIHLSNSTNISLKFYTAYYQNTRYINFVIKYFTRINSMNRVNFGYQADLHLSNSTNMSLKFYTAYYQNT